MSKMQEMISKSNTEGLMLQDQMFAGAFSLGAQESTPADELLDSCHIQVKIHHRVTLLAKPETGGHVVATTSAVICRCAMVTIALLLLLLLMLPKTLTETGSRMRGTFLFHFTDSSQESP